jgi:hypothetical protein
MKSRILVATHKKYDFPNNALYEPIQVGAALSKHNFGYLQDSEGRTISSKNRSYSELTALYWAWKNDYFRGKDYCGLVHYRRYFKGGLPFGKFSILSAEEIETYLSRYDIILPKKRNYYIENVRSHYGHAHYKKDLDILEALIRKRTPEYSEAFETVMSKTKLHLYNMFVMKSEDFNRYMEWLFTLMPAVEEKIDISDYDDYQARVFGFLSERLFNVWLVKNELKIKSISVVNLEGENLLLKAIGMLKRKYNKV